MPDFKVSYNSKRSFDREVSKVYWIDTRNRYFLVTDKYNEFLWVPIDDCTLVEEDIHD